jgi:hypothetical protein
VTRARARSLEAVAQENGVEGCVHETFGALILLWQASHAEDPQIARVLRTVAKDEMRHAALAWGLARWIEPRLDAAAHRRVTRRRGEAAGRLARAVRRAIDPSLARVAGLPAPADAMRLVEGATLGLWADDSRLERPGEEN